jgi:hypothetical protein
MARRGALIAGVVAASFVLAGCASSPPLPAPTVTIAASPAPTVTATPAPVTADSPLQPIDAWAICASFMIGLPQKLNSFGPDTVSQKNGVFTVITVGNGGSAGASCTITGTLGKPTVTDWHTPR